MRVLPCAAGKDLTRRGWMGFGGGWLSRGFLKRACQGGSGLLEYESYFFLSWNWKQ